MSEIKVLRLSIEGMSCNGCAASIESQLNHPGILNKEISYDKGSGEILIDTSQVTPQEIGQLIQGMSSYRVSHMDVRDKDSSTQRPSFDLIIIGGGSAAFSAAIKANELGKKTLIVNAGRAIGGTCVNEGCVPSKFLIRAAEDINQAKNSPFDSIEVTGQHKVHFKQLMQEKRALVSSLRQEKYLDILKGLDQVQLIEGYGVLVDRHHVKVKDKIFSTDQILIATGSSTFIPDIEGLEEAGYLTASTLFELEHQPEELIVVGGGYVALELAQMMQRLGTKVTIVQRSARLLSGEQPDVGKEIQSHLEAEGIQIHTSCKVERISRTKDGVLLEMVGTGIPDKIRAEALLLATGIRPNTNDLGLEKTEVSLDVKGAIKTNPYLQTSVPNIWAAGDCTQGPAYVYTAAYEGALAVENMFAKDDCCSSVINKVDYTGLPWVIFTDPQVAGVGMDERQAEEAGIEVEVSRLPMAYVPRCIVAKDTRGWIKLIRAKEDHRMIGARIVAPEGSELTMELSLAIKKGMTSEALAHSFHAYLTLSEAVKLAAIGFGKPVEKLSCCAT